MKRLIVILALFVGQNALAQNTDSTLVYALIAESKSDSNSYSSLRKAEKADSLANFFGLEIQLTAAQNLLDKQVKLNRSYEGLRTFLHLNKLLEKLDRWDSIVRNYQQLGEYYAEQNLISSAAEKYIDASQIAKNHNVQFDAWANEMRIGDLKMQIPDFESALSFYQSALTICRENNEPKNREISALRKIAQVNNATENYQSALEANLSVFSLMDEQADPKAYMIQQSNIGYAYFKVGDYNQALNYFLATLASREKLGYENHENIPLFINIGIAYQNLGDTKQSLTYLNKAAAASKNYEELSRINDLIALAYLANNEVLQAREYAKKSLIQAKQSKNKRAEASALYTASVINENLLEFDKALADYRKYRTITDSLDGYDKSQQQELIQAEYAIERTQGEIQQLIASNEIKDYQIQQLQLESDNRAKALALEQERARSQLQALQLERTRLEKESQEKEVEALKAREENQRLQLQQQRLEEEKAKKELELAEEQNRVQQLEIEQKAAANRNLYIILSLGLLLFVLSIYALWRTNKSNRQLAASKELIKQERDRSDTLLLNILPKSTADELKREGRASPKLMEAATVFFSDFKSFSSLSKDYTPEELIEELERFFGGFDSINAKYGIEKIKTIGDAYMCASGLPQPQEDHAHRMIDAAVEMLEFAKEVNKDQIKRGKQPWYLRIGINSGPVVAGVIGSKKFIYDVWGDTVNLASRLETAGEPSKINISESTMALVKEVYRTEYRGEIEVKNMGAVKMFFIKDKRAVFNQGIN